MDGLLHKKWVKMKVVRETSFIRIAQLLVESCSVFTLFLVFDSFLVDFVLDKLSQVLCVTCLFSLKLC